MEIYRQALELESESGRSFAELVNLIRKHGYNKTLLILIG